MWSQISEYFAAASHMTANENREVFGNLTFLESLDMQHSFHWHTLNFCSKGLLSQSKKLQTSCCAALSTQRNERLREKRDFFANMSKNSWQSCWTYSLNDLAVMTHFKKALLSNFLLLKMPMTVLILRVSPSSIHLTFSCLPGTDWTSWEIPDTSLPAGSISGTAWVLSLPFSFCQGALSYGSSLVTFPETTLTLASRSPSARLAEG